MKQANAIAVRGGFLRVLACGAVLAMTTAVYAAPVKWTLQGVVFGDGATATGEFTYDATTNLYSAWDIDVTAGTFTAYNYRPVVDGGFLGQRSASYADFGAFPALRGRYVHLLFDTPLTDLGGTTSLDVSVGQTFRDQSYECDNCQLFRYVTQGAVTTSPVPEPATIALLGLGLAGLAASRRRKQ